MRHSLPGATEAPHLSSHRRGSILRPTVFRGRARWLLTLAWLTAIGLTAIGLGAIALGPLAPGTAHAAEISVGPLSASTQDPDAVTFQVRVTAPAGLATATLSYRVLNPTGGDVGGSGEASFGPGPENDVSFQLATRTAQRFIPVGSRFVYHWEFEDLDGDVLVTAEQEYLFLDGRYPWESMSEGNVTVYWYGDSERFAEQALLAMRTTLRETGALLGVEVEYPVRVLVWKNTEEGSQAVRPGRTTENQFTRLGGQRVAPDLLFVFDQRADTVLHEGAHIVTHIAGDGAFARVPSWLDEGTAVYAQQDNDISYALALQFAVQNDSTLSLRSLTTPPGREDQTLLFYGQSFAIVDFMIEQFGRENFSRLYQTIFEGTRIDNALQDVYGFDTDGLYNRWREATGLEPVASSAPVLTQTAVPEGTVAPLAIPTAVAAAADSAGDTGGGGGDGSSASAATDDAGAGGAAAAATADGDSNTTTGIIVAIVTVLAAALLGGGGLLLMRRGRSAGA